MSISKPDIKKLWGRAAGRCSKPDCGKDCVPFLNPEEPTVVGEMAHVIPKKSSGPRAIKGEGNDDYENLILLCPTHHTEVDKAPDGTYPEDMLHQWKSEHETRVESLDTPKFETRDSLCEEIKPLLIENNSIWKQFGPESIEAKSNPLSNLKNLWDLRKLDTIVPNNSRIISILRGNRKLFDPEEYEICVQFIGHANAFELNCYKRTEGVPQFPEEFEELVNNYV